MATCFHPYSPEDIQRTKELKELTELFAPMFGTALSANINDIIGAWQETKEARGMLPSNEDFFEFLFNGVYDKPQVPKHLIKEVVAAHVEKAEIRKQAIENGTYLKAPNGNKSNLNEKQWLQVRTKAFKKWFGDWENNPSEASKVVDENGEPLVVYHGSNEYGFSVFDPSKSDDKISLFASSSKWIASTYTNFQPLENALIRKELLKGNAIDLIKNRDWKSLEKLINSVVDTTLPRPEESDFPLPYGNKNALDTIFTIQKELDNPNLTEEEHLSILADLIKAEDEYYYSGNYTFRVRQRTSIHGRKSVEISIEDSYMERFSTYYTEEGIIFRGSPEELIESLTFDTKVYDLFLNIKNPLIIDNQFNEYGHANNWNGLDFSPAAKDVPNRSLWGEVIPGTHKETTTRDVAAYAKKNNYDGVIFKRIADKGGYPGYQSLNPMTASDYLYEDLHMDEDSFNATEKRESDIFIAFNSNQIKSATDNIGTYSEEEDNIYYQKPILTELQKLKIIHTPLKTRGSIKKMKEALQRTGVSPLIYNTLIEAIKTDPSLAELTPYDLFQLISSSRYKDMEMDYHKSIEEPIIEGLETHLKEFLKKFKISFVDGAKLCEEQGVFGAYDILNKVIYLAKNRNAITMPEETAHAIVELLGARPHKNIDKFPETKDITFLLEHVEKTAIYKRVLEEYSNTYVKKNGKPDILKIKKEAIGQALAVAIKNNWENKTLEEEKSFWKKLKDLFNRIMSVFKDAEYLSFESLLNTIAQEVINNDYSRFEKIDSSKYSMLEYGETIAEQNKKDKGKALSFMKWFSSIGNVITGSLAYRKQGSVYRGHLDALHDIDMIVPFEAHNIDMNNADFKNLVQQSEEDRNQTVLKDYFLNTEYFKKIQAKYPKMKFGTAFPTISNVTINAVYSENEELSDKFLKLSGSYAKRLESFTEAERAQIYLFDFFIKPEGIITNTIEDSEYGLSLAHWKHAMIEKVFSMGRAKDIFDYQSWELFEAYKEKIPSEKKFLMFQKQPSDKGENISSTGSDFAKQLTNPGNDIPVIYKGKTFRNAEHAYQTWKSGEFDESAYNSKGFKPVGSKKVNKAVNFDIMVEIITAKLQQNPTLIQGINERGGLDYINNSTHNVTGDTYWESSGENKFIEALAKAYEKAIATPSIQFTTSNKEGYAERTLENADLSDVTMALAENFSTYGETLTAHAAGSRDEKYLEGKNHSRTVRQNVIDKHLPYKLNKTANDAKTIASSIFDMMKTKKLPTENIKINVAGNGISNLSESQEYYNNLVTDVIKELQNLGITISEIRSGGQTGIDEAGIMAAQRLGIPAVVHGTKDWAFRGKDGKDVKGNEKAYKARFGVQSSTANTTSNLTASSNFQNYTIIEDYLTKNNNEIKINGVAYNIKKTQDPLVPYVAFRKGPQGEAINVNPFQLKTILEEMRYNLQMSLNKESGISSFKASETSLSETNKLNKAIKEEQALGEILNLTAPQIEEITDLLLMNVLGVCYSPHGLRGQACLWLENQLNSENVSDEQKAVYAETLQQIGLFKKVFTDYRKILPKEFSNTSFTAYLTEFLRSFADMDTHVKKLAAKVKMTPEHPRYQEYIDVNTTRLQLYFGWVKKMLDASPEQYKEIEDIFIKKVYTKFQHLTGYKVSYKRKETVDSKETETSAEETVSNTFGEAFSVLEEQYEQLVQEEEDTSIQAGDSLTEENSETDSTDRDIVGDRYSEGSFEDSLKQSSFSTLSSSLKLLYAIYLKQGFYKNDGEVEWVLTLEGKQKPVNPREVHGILAHELANCTTFEQMMELLRGSLSKKYVWAEKLARLVSNPKALGIPNVLYKQFQNQFFNAYRKETNNLVRVNHTTQRTYVDELGTHSGIAQLYDALHETFNSTQYIIYNEKNSLYNAEGTLNIIKLSKDEFKKYLDDIYQNLVPDAVDRELKITRVTKEYLKDRGDKENNVYLTPIAGHILQAVTLWREIEGKQRKNDVTKDVQTLSEYLQEILLSIGIPIYKFPELITVLNDPKTLMSEDEKGMPFGTEILNILSYFNAPPMYLHQDKILYENHSQQTEDTSKIDDSSEGNMQQITVNVNKKAETFKALYDLKESQKGKTSFAWDIKILYKQNYANLFRLLESYITPKVEGMVQEKGKTYYPFQPSSYGGNLINDLANASNLSDRQYQQWMEQTFSKDPLLATTDEYGRLKWLHPILKHLYLFPDRAKLIKKQTIKFVDKEESEEWTDLDYLKLMDDLAHKHATPTDGFYRTFLLPVISDKHAVEAVVSPVSELFGNDLFSENDFSWKGKRAIHSILEAEYNRIAKFSEITKEINAKTDLGAHYKNQIGISYLKKAATWTVFPELNNFSVEGRIADVKKTWSFYELMTAQKVNGEQTIVVDEDRGTEINIEDYIYSTLYDLLDKRFNRFQTKLNQELDLAKRAGKQSKMLEGFGGYQPLKNLYVWDTLQQAWWSQLLLGDGANYKSAVEMTKRTNQMHSGTNKINTGNPELEGNSYDSSKLVKENYIVLEDPQAKSEHRDKEIAQIIENLNISDSEKNALRSVWNTTMDLTDGQSQRNLSSYKEILMMAGMDSLEIDRIFNNFKEGKFVYTDLEKVLVSLKPFYVGEEIQTVTDKDGNVVYTSRKILQHKNQEGLLAIRDILRTAANKSGFYRELQNFMDENNIAIVLFNSNVKVGGTPVIPLSNDIQELSEGRINGQPLSKYLKNVITTNPFFKKERALKYYGISTATDDHLTNKSRARGTQMVRLMLSDLKVIEEENTPEYKQLVNNFKQICLDKGLLELQDYKGRRHYAYTEKFIQYVQENFQDEFGIDIQNYTLSEAFPFFLEYLMTKGESEFKYLKKIKTKKSEEVYVFGEDTEGNTTLEEAETGAEEEEWREHTFSLTLTPIYYKVGNKNFTSLELRLYYQKLLLEGVRRAKEKFNKSFESIEDIQKLIFDFIDSSNRYSADLKECFKIVERKVNGKTVKEFALGFGDPLRAHDLEPLLLALVKDRILTQTTRGGEAVQLSSIGATDLHMRFQNSEGAFIFNEKEWEDPSLVEASMRDTLNGLKKKYSSYEEYSKNADGQAGSIAYLECYLPPHLKDLVKYSLVQKTDNGSSYYELDSSKIPEDLKTAIGYRVPTENKYSIANLRIKGFLPPGSSTVMLPHEWLIMSGSDFDIDKLFFIFKELKKTKPDLNQFFQKETIKYNEETKDTSYWEIFLNTIQHDFSKKYGEEILNELRKAKNTKEVKTVLKNYKDIDFKDFLDQFENTLIALWQEGHSINIFPYEAPEYDWNAPMEEQTMAQCNNAVFDIMQTIMASKESVNTILQSNNIKPLVELASNINIWKNLSSFKKYIEEKSSDSKIAVSNGEGLTHLENAEVGSKYSEPSWKKLEEFSSIVKDSFLSTVTAGTDFYDITDRVARWRNNMDGSNLIPPHAIHNVHIGVAQGIDYPIQHPFTIANITYNSLSNKYNADGSLISSALAMNVAGAVDNGKQPTLGALMQHSKTVHITDFMLRAGVDKKTIVWFLSHPDISNILNESRYSNKSVRALTLQAIRTLETSYEKQTGQPLLGIAAFNPSADDLAVACLDPQFLKDNNIHPKLLEAPARLQMLQVFSNIEQDAMYLSNQVRNSRSDSLKNASFIYKYAIKQKRMDEALGHTNNPNAMYLKGLNEMGWRTVKETYGPFHPIIKNIDKILELTKSYTPFVLSEWMLNYQYFQLLQLPFFNDMSAENFHIDTSVVQNKDLKKMFDMWNNIQDFDSLESKQRWFSLEFPTYLGKTLNVLQNNFTELFVFDNKMKQKKQIRSFLLDLQVSSKTKKRARQSIGISNFRYLKLQEGYLSLIQQQVVDMSNGKGVLNPSGLATSDINELNIFLKNLINHLFIFDVMTSAFERTTNSIASIFNPQYLTNIPGYGEILQKGDDSLMEAYHTQFILNKLGRVGFVKEISPESEEGKKLLDIIQKYKKGESTVIPNQYWYNLSFGSQSGIVKIKDKTRTVFVGCISQDLQEQSAELGIIHAMGKYGTYNQYNPFAVYPLFESPAFMQDTEGLTFPIDLAFQALRTERQAGKDTRFEVGITSDNKVALVSTDKTVTVTLEDIQKGLPDIKQRNNIC